ncbi:MAG: methyltransferase domain-containing protein [Pirellulales bacterium]|nr:methyltransferase domain-containing protein [Pirellulales bacterium]
MPARNIVRFFAVLLALVGVVRTVGQTPQAPADAAAATVPADINAPFLARDIDVEEWVRRFEVESREIFRAYPTIVSRLKLQPGERIADVGAGTGLFIESFSRGVGPDGWVYAIEIAPTFLERIGAMAEIRGLTNVTPVLAAQDDVRLPPDSIDVAFICDVYHHFEQPQASLASLRRALKPGGRLVVIDFERIAGVSREWTFEHVRAGKEVFRSEIEAAGFRFKEEVLVREFKENYFLVFGNP